MTVGTFRKYINKNFKPRTLEVIAQANAIIQEYEGRGYAITLRQLYYQFVSRDLLPNKQAEYDRLGRILSDARLAGLVSWTALEDRGRNLRGLETWDSPVSCITSAVADYRIDAWANQRWRPEVWVEKQAMEGNIQGICCKLRVDFFATKGYNSQSEQWRAGRRFASYIAKGQTPIVFHLADHDPSGFDMTEDLRTRLEIFAGLPIAVHRLALNPDQVHKYSPPPNPAKETDSRYAEYVQKYGDYSWELDALSPDVISRLIQDAVEQIRDPKLWDEAMEEETADRMVLDSIIEELGGENGEEDQDT